MIREWIESNFEGISTSLVGLISIALLGTLVGKALRYLLSFIIGAGIDAEALGVFTFGLVLVRAGGMLSSIGLRTASQRLIATNRTRGDSAGVVKTTILAVLMPFVLGLIVSSISYTLWPIITSLLQIDMPQVIRVFLLGIPLFAVMDVGASATRGFKTTRYYVYIREIGQSGLAAFLVGFAVLTRLDFVTVIYAYLFSLLFGTGLSVYFLSKLTPDIRGSLADFPVRATLSVSIPLLVVAASQYFVTWTDILILGALRPPMDVGYYQAAFLYSSLVTVVLFGVNAIFPALAADLYESGKIEYLETIYSVVTKWSVYIIGLLAVMLIFLSDELLRLFGPDFLRARQSLKILIAGQTIAAATGPVSYLLTMTDFEKFESYNSVGLGVLNLLLNAILIPEFGIEGAAVATTVSLVLLNLVRLAQVKWLLGFSPYNRRYWKGGIALIVATILIYLVSRLRLDIFHPVLIIAIGMLSFTLVLLFLGPDEEDRELLSLVS